MPPTDPFAYPDDTQPPAPTPRPLPVGVQAVAGLLLAIPLIALIIVPVYARSDPHLWGFPFFYWYQFLWVLLTAGFTYAAYLIVQRARRSGAGR